MILTGIGVVGALVVITFIIITIGVVMIIRVVDIIPVTKLIPRLRIERLNWSHNVSWGVHGSRFFGQITGHGDLRS